MFGSSPGRACTGVWTGAAGMGLGEVEAGGATGVGFVLLSSILSSTLTSSTLMASVFSTSFAV